MSNDKIPRYEYSDFEELVQADSNKSDIVEKDTRKPMSRKKRLLIVLAILAIIVIGIVLAIVLPKFLNIKPDEPTEPIISITINEALKEPIERYFAAVWNKDYETLASLAYTDMYYMLSSNLFIKDQIQSNIREAIEEKVTSVGIISDYFVKDIYQFESDADRSFVAARIHSPFDEAYNISVAVLINITNDTGTVQDINLLVYSYEGNWYVYNDFWMNVHNNTEDIIYGDAIN